MCACPPNERLAGNGFTATPLPRPTLVGAGPGDPDLLTLRAVKAIQRADAVLYDALIDPAILDLARPEARLIDVGKRCGRHAMNQAAINALIVTTGAGRRTCRAAEGRRSVRVRPRRRGTGQLARRRRAGRGVPGVTAACAAAASLQIPLTHRDDARSLHFVTGHGSDGAVPAHDWHALACPAARSPPIWPARRSGWWRPA